MAAILDVFVIDALQVMKNGWVNGAFFGLILGRIIASNTLLLLKRNWVVLFLLAHLQVS